MAAVVAAVAVVYLAMPADSAQTADSAQSVPPRPSQAVFLGAALTQHTADPWNPRTATDRATGILGSTVQFANQHIMGFGALNPEPRPGERDWSSLDTRMKLIAAAGVQPVVTLCCAPDWMKGGEPGETDWSQIEVAPTPEHYADFAELAVAVARRYPQVRYFVVWNELKGFFDDDLGRWNIESYTQLYNTVYRALKAYDPSLKVGGPYVSMDSWSHPQTASDPSLLAGPWGVVDQRALDAVNYWLAHAAGADFIAVDGSNDTEDAGLTTKPELANAKFSMVTRWLVSRTPIPIWWMETYPNVAPGTDVSSEYAADVALDAILRIGDAGGNVVFLWQPEADPESPLVALWDSTAEPDGGRPQPLVRGLNAVEDLWSAGHTVRHEWRDGRLVLAPVDPTATSRPACQ